MKRFVEIKEHSRKNGSSKRFPVHSSVPRGQLLSNTVEATRKEIGRAHHKLSQQNTFDLEKFIYI